MPESIRFYSKSKDYFWMSNFHVSPFDLDGETWPTVEHYFQAAKTDDLTERERVRSADTPGKAKARGRKVSLRSNWEQVKEDVMHKALAAKFSNTELKAKLLATGEVTLIEAAPRDYYWGAGAKGTGKNRMGILLMRVRNELHS